MIPSVLVCKEIWDEYDLPPEKRRHVLAVWSVVDVMIHCALKQAITVNKELLDAATLLHDIDKNVQKLPGENHPDACIRIIKKHGYDELIPVIRAHPLHTITDPVIKPSTIEERMLYVADKMTKFEPIGIEKRFQLWMAEDPSTDEKMIIQSCFQPAKQLSDSLLSDLGITEKELISRSIFTLPVR